MATDFLPAALFKSVPQDLLCSVCSNVPRNAVMPPCEHICCLPCAENWKNDVGTCPICEMSMVGRTMVPPGRIVLNLYRQLEMSCENKDRGCEAWIPIEDVVSHQANCPKALICCPNSGCGATVGRDTLPIHEANCPHRLVSCALCSATLSFSEMDEHDAKYCPMAEIECCGQKMRRGDLDRHCQQGCRDRQLVPCPLGCGKNVPQGDVEHHISSSLSSHLQLIVSERGNAHALQQEVFRLTKTSDSISKELQKAKAAIQNLQAERRESAWYGMGGWRQDPEGRCVWSVGNMNQRLKAANLKQQATAPLQCYLPDLLWSPQFYTHQAGYRFSIRLDLGTAPNSIGLFIHLHQGENDDNLPWPFNLDYTVQFGSIQSTITQRDSYYLYSSMGRPPHEFSWGWANFCALSDFKEAIVGDTLDVAIFFHSSTSVPTAGRMPNPDPAKQSYHTNGNTPGAAY